MLYKLCVCFLLECLDGAAMVDTYAIDIPIRQTNDSSGRPVCAAVTSTVTVCTQLSARLKILLLLTDFSRLFLCVC